MQYQHQQNLAIAKKIAERQKTMTVEDLLMSFSSSEWEQYLIFIMFVGHPKESPESRYDLQKVTFRFEFKGKIFEKESPEVIVPETFQKFIEIALPKHRRNLSQGIDNLLRKYTTDTALVLSIFRTFDQLTHLKNGEQFASFDFEVLMAIIENEKTDVSVRNRALGYLLNLEGIDRPSPSVLIRTANAFCDAFEGNDVVMKTVFQLFVQVKSWEKALLTLRYLECWPKDEVFETAVIAALQGHMGEEKKGRLDFIFEQILPGFGNVIHDKVVTILKEHFISSDTFSKAQEISVKRFPVEQWQAEKINGLELKVAQTEQA